jgi:hypothetical protein
MSEPILNAIVIHNGIAFTRNAAGYLLYDGQPLGVLKWGHPALIAALGSQYASPDAFTLWLKATASGSG